ncbi:MAG: hypothetical protein R2874_12105 [Desulfobacterales bacterium]
MRKKPQIIVLNKIDMPDTEKTAAAFRAACGQKPVYTISGDDRHCRSLVGR